MKPLAYIGKQCIYKGVALTLQRGTDKPCEGCYVDNENPDECICELIGRQRGQRDCSDLHNAIWVKSPERPRIAMPLVSLRGSY